MNQNASPKQLVLLIQKSLLLADAGWCCGMDDADLYSDDVEHYNYTVVQLMMSAIICE